MMNLYIYVKIIIKDDLFNFQNLFSRHVKMKGHHHYKFYAFPHIHTLHNPISLEFNDTTD